MKLLFKIGMKGKRGFSHHLDWIIGISIFMLYVLFMIVTIKPGVQPLHKGYTLITIVQDNFVNNVTWNITRVPLSVDVSCTNLATPAIQINFPFDGWINSKTDVYDKSTNQVVSSSLSGNSLSIQFGETDGTKNYYILYSEEDIFTKQGDSPGASCSNDINFIYGVPELLKGLSEDKISAADYEQVKDIWNYPTNNDFNITVDIKGRKYEISNPNGPPKNANVYVRQFTDFILENSGEKTPATISISVW